MFKISVLGLNSCQTSGYISQPLKIYGYLSVLRFLTHRTQFTCGSLAMSCGMSLGHCKSKHISMAAHCDILIPAPRLRNRWLKKYQTCGSEKSGENHTSPFLQHFMFRAHGLVSCQPELIEALRLHVPLSRDL
jgi:hypothetical protein